jgi:hypothetical protein
MAPLAHLGLRGPPGRRLTAKGQLSAREGATLRRILVTFDPGELTPRPGRVDPSAPES